MRNSKNFKKLLNQYESTPISTRSSLFQKMKRNARTFSDWASVYQYAGYSIRKDAQREMERLVLRGDTVSNIQLNILELFMIIDQGDKEAILEKYLKKYHKKDDLLFVLSLATGDNRYIAMKAMYGLEKHYKKIYNISKGVEARERKSKKMLKELSTFNPWHERKTWARSLPSGSFFIYLYLPYLKLHLQLVQVIQKFRLILSFHAHYFYYDMRQFS